MGLCKEACLTLEGRDVTGQFLWEFGREVWFVVSIVLCCIEARCVSGFAYECLNPTDRGV